MLDKIISDLPEDIHIKIATLVSDHLSELAKFRQVCKTFNEVGSQEVVFQPIYNHLYHRLRIIAIDNSLPEALPIQNTQIFFEQVFKDTQLKQKEEIAYLTNHHPVVITKPEYAQLLQDSTSELFDLLEIKNMLLNNINSEIITDRINLLSDTLNLDSAHITRLPIELFQDDRYIDFFQNLTILSCQKNQLTRLDLPRLMTLEVLYCDENQLVTLNVQELVALQQLTCSYNRLATLNVQAVTTLQELYCNNNLLSELNVHGLTTLQKLSCTNNQITDLPVQELLALRELYCSFNQLTTLNIQELTALQNLQCNNNKLTTLNAQGLTLLQFLYCDNNQLTMLNVERLLALQDLRCNHNQLTSLELRGLIALQDVDCESNKLTVLDVRGLSSLSWLDCDNNPLRHLTLTGVHPYTKNKYAKLEKRLRSAHLRQLNPSLSPAATFLPSFDVNKNSSPSIENTEVKIGCDENLEAKRRKKDP